MGAAANQARRRGGTPMACSSQKVPARNAAPDAIVTCRNARGCSRSGKALAAWLAAHIQAPVRTGYSTGWSR